MANERTITSPTYILTNFFNIKLKICLYCFSLLKSNLFFMLSLESTGRVGDPCQRSYDCSEGLCCARHFWTRICKPVLREGQVCTRHGRKGNHGLELFQRCPCDEGLSCQKLQGLVPRPSSKSEAEMTLQLASVSSPSRHSSPHTSPLSSTPKSLSAVAKTRLHVCQKD